MLSFGLVLAQRRGVEKGPLKRQRVLPGDQVPTAGA